jgi:hypothetical protein
MVLCPGCAGTRKATFPAAGALRGATGGCSLGPASIAALAATLAQSLGDTTVTESVLVRTVSAYASDSGDTPSLADLEPIAEALDERSFVTFRPDPATYESVRALAALPVAVALLVLRFPDGQPEPLDREKLLASPDKFLTPLLPDISAHILSSVRNREERYTLRCHSGETIRGDAHDKLCGQVYMGSGSDGSLEYRQVVGLYVLSRMPLTAAEEHVDEWFEAMPYTYQKPVLKRVR